MANYGTATYRQRWALFCATKKDYRKVNISKEEASKLINESLLAKNKVVVKKQVVTYEMIWGTANTHAMEAYYSCKPVPMVVQQHANVLDDNSPVKQEWFVEGGVCGFAWVYIRPARGKFYNWAKSKELTSPRYYGGAHLNVPQPLGQSMARAEAYCRAFAKSLADQGIDNIYSESRID